MNAVKCPLLLKPPPPKLLNTTLHKVVLLGETPPAIISKMSVAALRADDQKSQT